MKKILAIFVLAAIIAGCSGCTPGKSGGGANDSAPNTVEGAVPLGQWADVEQHSSGKNYPCKVRIVGVIRDAGEVQSRIDEYNTNASRTVEPLTGKDKDLTEYIVIEYEVLFPDDFPTVEFGNHGIYSPEVSFDGKTNNGKGFIASDGTQYVGMGMNTQLIKPSDDELPLPGDTFQGAILLQMIKKYDKFHLRYMYKSGDGEDYIDALFAIK